MSEFDKVANDILRGLNENFINSAADAIQHTWAKTIAHPGLGEEDEEFAVIDHSLTSDGIIEEYYVFWGSKRWYISFYTLLDMCDIWSGANYIYIYIYKYYNPI